MYSRCKGRILFAVLALSCLAAAQIACGLLSTQDSGPSNPPGPGPADQGGESPGEGNASGQGAGDSSSGEQGENPIEPEFGADTLPCPPKGTILFLGFDHALTINYGETSINHFLTEGFQQLEVVDEDGTIMPVGSPSIAYFMEGKMSDECTLESEGTMMPTAHGTCENGVVSLFIEENWLPLEGQMVCIDPDGDVDIVPFNVPPMGVQTHSGPNGAGEIFYLVQGAEGYSTMRPFLEGDGYHTWTLYTTGEDDIPPVPIVP
jgi:hypothetical protein